MRASSMHRRRRPTARARPICAKTSIRTALRPLNMYGYSKHLFDLWARREGVLDARRRDQVLQRVRPQRGPQGRHAQRRRQSVRANRARAARCSSSPATAAACRDGEQTRDFLYVKDAVAITAFLGRTRDGNGLYNVGAGVARTWNDLARAIFAALERPARDRIHPDARRAAREIPVPHPSHDRRTARGGLRRRRSRRSKTRCATMFATIWRRARCSAPNRPCGRSSPPPTFSATR